MWQGTPFVSFASLTCYQQTKCKSWPKQPRTTRHQLNRHDNCSVHQPSLEPQTFQVKRTGCPRGVTHHKLSAWPHMRTVITCHNMTNALSLHLHPLKPFGTLPETQLPGLGCQHNCRPCVHAANSSHGWRGLCRDQPRLPDLLDAPIDAPKHWPHTWIEGRTPR